jgi:hypothetical protein
VAARYGDSTPVPLTATVSGAAVALLAMLTFAERLAAASGWNLTVIVHEAPGARLAGQFSVMGNHEALVPVTLMLSIAKLTAPALVSVALSGALVVPTTTLPNLRAVGLTTAAGVTVSVLAFVMPLAVPEIDAVVFASTLLVVTSNDADCSPCGTTTAGATG